MMATLCLFHAQSMTWQARTRLVVVAAEAWALLIHMSALGSSSNHPRLGTASALRFLSA